MTAKTQTETGARKSKKLKLNKQTLQDLTSRDAKADGVRGGVPGPTRGALAACPTSSFHITCYG